MAPCWASCVRRRRSSAIVRKRPERRSAWPEARVRTSCAAWSGETSRPSSKIFLNHGIHIRPASESSASSAIAVRTVPGSIANARTPRAPASAARFSVKRIKAVFATT
jgi:hypothetical protein